MEYPGSRMTRPVRLTLLAFFIVLFFLLCPVIIMYTAGYRYDWRQGLLRETGAIDIDILPKNTAVFLNEIKVKTKMPARLNDRVPGKYEVRLLAPGYRVWTKEIEVKNKQTVYIKEISLLKDGQPELLAEGHLTETISSDGRYLVLLKQNNDKIEVELMDAAALPTDKISTLPSDRLSASQVRLLAVLPSGDYTAKWAPDNDFFVVSKTKPPISTLLIFRASEPDKKIDLAALAKAPITKFQWKESSEAELYFSTAEEIFSFLPIQESITKLSKNKFQDWLAEGGQFWVLTTDEEKKIKLISDALGFSNEYGPTDALGENAAEFRLAAAKNGTVLLKRIDRPEMLIIRSDEKFSVAGEKFLLSPYNDWWLIWTPWEIWTYNAKEEPNLLNRSGQQLRQILPLDEHNTLALVWAEKTTALFPYYLVSEDLIGGALTSAAADYNKKIMYFSGALDGKSGLWRLGY